MNKFTGLYTALITPFNEDKSIDYNSLEQLILHQIEGGVDGLVLLGTTAESPTIDGEEFKSIIKFATNIIKGRIKVIVGTGSNDTKQAINKSIISQDLGADAILSVNPYYNKPPQAGLYTHFSSIADSIKIPMILYNIKGRTAVNLETETVVKLSKHQNIVGVKEASGDMQQIMDVIESTDSDFTILSGDDSLTLPIMVSGGHGVVSVISNIFPSEMKNMVDQCLAGNFDAAKNSHYKIYNLMKALLSSSTNPIPIKTLLAHIGKIKDEFRLPLCKMDKQNSDLLIKSYKNYING
ncbi:MAG: 4-hydroxy-tetrahydrodipicolinate synthase [Candidatus Midichloriaceae bacterium]|jgi:4-hydroxy-tetrahydrodipicolinate synthase